MSARRRNAVFQRRKHRRPRSFQFVRLWTDKYRHKETNNYRKAHGLPMLSKGHQKRVAYICNFLRCYREFVNERGSDG